MKTIIYYYSNKGSNRYLTNKITGELKCEMEEIKPRLNFHLLLLIGLNLGNRKLKTKVEDYDTVILCGPIWVGKLIPPLRSFIKKYADSIQKLVFVTCCGSSYEKKDEKFGHELVFKDVKNLLNEKCIFCQAFPISLVLPDDKKEDPDATMKTRLNDENFKGEIQERFESFINKLTEMN